MNIGIDIDGVLADFSTAFRLRANSLFPDKRVPLNKPQTSWDFDCLGYSKDEIDAVWEDIERESYFWQGLEPFENNVSALRGFLLEIRFQRPNISFYYLTSRKPFPNRPSALLQSQQWLAYHGLLLNNTSVITTGSSSTKVELLKTLKVAYFLDDYIPTIRKSDALGQQAFLLLQPWNSREAEESPIRVVKSVQEYADIIRQGIGLNSLGMQKGLVLTDAH